MRFHAKCAHLFLLFCLAATPATWAQQKQGQDYRVTREDASLPHKARPLTLDEGLAILSAALDSRHHKGFSSDCSHFVHGLYERAGFPYAYAPSPELYAGIDEFRRVTNPQPGDLAVWRGHAGIVVNPAQHSFFSLLRSGPGVGSYYSAYWKRRGPPRFFRYVQAVPGGALSSSMRNASLRPTALASTELREPDADTEDALSDMPASDMSEGRSNESAYLAKRTANQPLNATIPPLPVVNSVHPNPEQVAAAFLQACTNSEPRLHGRDLFNSAQPLIVFDHFTVRKVHIAGNQDWVDVQIDELVSLTAGKADVHKRSERQRWTLIRRDRTSWELSPPRDTIYLPQPIAVHILAQQLAQLTGDRPSDYSPATGSRPQEKAELARLLNALLEK
jgi:hypothetical protein